MSSDDVRASVRIGALEVYSVIDSEASNGTHTVIEVVVRPGGQMPAPHSHDAFEETFLGLEGLVTVIVEGREHRLGVGQAVCIKRGEIHGFRNDTEQTVRFIGIAAPGVFGWPYFQELSADLLAWAAPSSSSACIRGMPLTPYPASSRLPQLDRRGFSVLDTDQPGWTKWSSTAGATSGTRTGSRPVRGGCRSCVTSPPARPDVYLARLRGVARSLVERGGE